MTLPPTVSQFDTLSASLWLVMVTLLGPKAVCNELCAISMRGSQVQTYSDVGRHEPTATARQPRGRREKPTSLVCNQRFDAP